LTNIKKGAAHMSNSNLKHLERIKENIDKSETLNEEEKSNSMKHIEAWYAEDKAWGVFLNELAEISPKVKTILADLGLL
jgi:flagellar biosynthesis regulator FlaF